jgi:hypothetical protein
VSTTARNQPLLGPHHAAVDFPADEGPYLLVIIDTEEEFDWGIVPSSSTRVATIREQIRAQRIYERFGVVPTYAVDYPVAAQRDGYEPLLGFLKDGQCEIGAQLHPWVNPPIEEELVERNSFPGNLPAALEEAKLVRLTRTIEANFGTRPILYRAGRFGAGPNTAEMLARLGYRIDCSVLPYTDLRQKHGPDYSRFTARPFWFGPDHRLLELPVTAGMAGALAPLAWPLFPRIAAPAGQRLHLPGLFARFRLLDRIRLTPEGTSLAEAKRVTRALLERMGHRVFVVTYHSPSLAPGHTPYVRSAADLQYFLGWLEAYLAFFFGEIGGKPATPGFILERALALGRKAGGRAQMPGAA